MTTACVLAFGGNAEASEDYFHQAIAALANADTVCKSFAKVIRSAPMGEAAGSEFVNSAGCFQTNLSPEALLKTIHEIESGLGRQRVLHWGPRPIDIDVLFYGQHIIDTPTVVIPHPCLWYRSFVLQPLMEICPEWIHPIFNESVEQLTRRLNRRPLQIDINNQIDNFPALDIAKKCWQHRDDILVGSTDASDKAIEFCTIVVEAAEQRSSEKSQAAPQLTAQPTRLQPCHETERIVRCILKQSNGANLLRQFLADFEVAAMG